MNERSNEQSGSSSASGTRQPEYGQYAQNPASGSGGEQHPDESRYGQYSTGGQGYSDQSGQDYANGGYTGGHGAQGYDSQPGYDQQAGGYPTHYQNGYQQQPYGGQSYSSQGYGAQGYGGYNNYPGQAQGPVPGKGLAIASLVLGIVGILSFWFLGLGGLLGLVGLVLGIIGLVKIRRSKRDSPALAIVGIVLSSLALLGGILIVALFAWVFSTSGDCLQYMEQGNQTQYQQCVEGSLNGTLDS